MNREKAEKSFCCFIVTVVCSSSRLVLCRSPVCCLCAMLYYAYSILCFEVFGVKCFWANCNVCFITHVLTYFCFLFSDSAGHASRNRDFVSAARSVQPGFRVAVSRSPWTRHSTTDSTHGPDHTRRVWPVQTAGRIPLDLGTARSISQTSYETSNMRIEIGIRGLLSMNLGHNGSWTSCPHELWGIVTGRHCDGGIMPRRLLVGQTESNKIVTRFSIGAKKCWFVVRFT